MDCDRFPRAQRTLLGRVILEDALRRDHSFFGSKSSDTELMQ